MTEFLSVLPILILIFWSLIRGVKESVVIALCVTTILFFYWGASFNHFLGAIGVSFITTINILMIVFGAAFLYDTMDKTGMIKAISHSLADIHPSKELRFFLLAIGLTAFFEGVAGFGTPGAIVPLLLIAMGFNAVLSVAVVLLFDGIFASFGAVGTPIITGLQFPLQLSDVDNQNIGLISAFLGIVVFFVLLFFTFYIYRRRHGALEYKRKIIYLYLSFSFPYFFFAYFATELATVLAALIMLLFALLYLKPQNTTINFRPWTPYAVLALLLLLPKIFYPLSQWIGWELAFPAMFGTSIHSSIKPLQSPLIPFLVVAIGVTFLKKSKTFYINSSLKKTASVFAVLFPSIAVAQLMINSGVTAPSMIENIATMMSSLGLGYVIASPILGAIGTFVTGSTTVSNIVFGPSQLQVTNYLDLPAVLILSLQLLGAALGNAICLFNIIAAASVANLQNYKDVLKPNLLPVIVGCILFGLAGLFMLFIFS